ncbi:MAG: ATP-grasp domain-containing protein [Candidatus Helarchaeota archaeon]|nr:ATP-grasp domain-containing protein [Candidatus Helarchaeota archaeon]
MILIVSFNARAIAQLAKNMGLEVAIVDFWGDQDLFPLSEKVFTVFKPKFKSYSAFPDQRQNEEKLVDLAFQVISKEKIDSVLIGSGLDDRPDLWERINSAVPILGNSPECVRRVRNLLEVQNKIQQENIKFPLTLLSTDTSEIEDFAARVGFPLVFKPLKTLGGVGIRLIQNESELLNFFEKYSGNLNGYYVQEYVRGENISTTIVGNKNDFKVLSINEQLIGIKKLGTNLPFKYCGNIIPFDCSPEIAHRIKLISIQISRMFKLSGVFGIDFVLQGNTPYFMEVNPRFPGTIELLAMISQLNAVKLHLDAVQGSIPAHLEKFRGFAMKCVLFAKKVIVTPDFEHLPHIYDIPPPNILLMPEDPICTVQLSDRNRERLQKKLNQMFLKIQ